MIRSLCGFEGFGQVEQLFRFGKRKRFQEHRVNCGEDRGVCVDAECERERSDQREPGRLPIIRFP